MLLLTVPAFLRLRRIIRIEQILNKGRQSAGAPHLKVVSVHQLHHLVGHLLQLFVRNAHLLHVVLDLRDVHLLGAKHTESFAFLFVAVHGLNKNHCRTAFASAT